MVQWYIHIIGTYFCNIPNVYDFNPHINQFVRQMRSVIIKPFFISTITTSKAYVLRVSVTNSHLEASVVCGFHSLYSLVKTLKYYYVSLMYAKFVFCFKFITPYHYTNLVVSVHLYLNNWEK